MLGIKKLEKTEKKIYNLPMPSEFLNRHTDKVLIQNTHVALVIQVILKLVRENRDIK